MDEVKLILKRDLFDLNFPIKKIVSAVRIRTQHATTYVMAIMLFL